jgi:Mg2+ and Co2+ transporter CorA
MTTPNKYDEQVLKDVADDLRGLVSDIESGIKTTQNHYGRYLSIITHIAGDNIDVASIIAAALIMAGANRKGVNDALKVGYQ